MADSTITGLPAASVITGSESIPLVQSGADKKATPAQLKTYINTGLSSYNYTTSAQLFEDFDCEQLINAAGNKYHYQGTYTILQSKAALITGITGYQAISGWVYAKLNSSTPDVSGVICRNDGATGSNYVQGSTWHTGDVYQCLIRVALLDLLPSVADNFDHRFGFACLGLSAAAMALAPFSTVGQETASAMGAAGYIEVCNATPNFRCVSGVGGTTQTTVTSVPYALNTLYTFRLKVLATGEVEFYINGTLVATHSTNGVITDGKSIGEYISTHNVAATAGTAKTLIVDAMGYKHDMATTRTGMAFD